MCQHIFSLLPALKDNIKRYKFNTKVCAGLGSFGIVVPGVDTVLNEDVVFKIECDDTVFTCNEVAAYTALKGIAGIPKFHRAVSFRGHGILIIELLGCNLEVFMDSLGGLVPIPTVYTLGRQLVRIVKQMHDRGVIHRDIKPHNILLPRSIELKPYLVDFGLAHPLEDPGCGQIPVASSSGTPTFMSLRTHQGKPSSRRDDIASLAYTLIYLAHGSLPWNNCNMSECMRQKSTFQVSQLHPRLPHKFQLFLDHANNLKYSQIPDYSFLEELLPELDEQPGRVPCDLALH